MLKHWDRYTDTERRTNVLGVRNAVDPETNPRLGRRGS